MNVILESIRNFLFFIGCLVGTFALVMYLSSKNISPQVIGSTLFSIALILLGIFTAGVIRYYRNKRKTKE